VCERRRRRTKRRRKRTPNVARAQKKYKVSQRDEKDLLGFFLFLVKIGKNW